MIIGWPQIVWICIVAMNLGMYLVKHGEEMSGKYNFFISLICQLISLWILYCGGFFG